jgi:hypothetical protein
MVPEYCECKDRLPLSVLRWVRAFGPRMQRGLVQALQERQATRGTLTVDDMAECIATAWAMLQADAELMTDFPPPDVDIVELARQAAREGRGDSIDGILHALS